MRLALILIALFALSTADARADVFVPADPPQTPAEPSAGCHAFQGGLELDGRYTSKGFRVRLRPVGGAWQRVDGLSDCPEFRVAADGTVVLSAGDERSGEVLIRPPGGAFRAPVKVRSRPLVAVSPGGWIAALVTSGEEFSTEDPTLTGLTITPGGALTNTVLGRGRPGAFAIDDGGTATAVWTDELTLRTARAAPGGPWVPARPFALQFPLGRAAGQLDLAISRSGHTLLAWVDDGTVQVSLDNGPAQTVAAASLAGSPRAAFDDAGNALIAFAARAGRVMTVERVAGGAWTPPRAIQGSRPAAETNDPTEEYRLDAREVELDVVLAPDGRAIVAWGGHTPRWFGLAAAAGRLGGGWSAPVVLSSPLRMLREWSAELTADGTPRVSWSEFDTDARWRTLSRAVVLVPDAAAPPADVTAPEVTATLPTRAPTTRRGTLRVTVPVRCSEACDVRLEIGGLTDVRSLKAGQTAKLRVATDDGGLAGRPGLRRFSVRLTVSDRAGNVVRRSSTLRVRVLRRSLRSFKVAVDHDFATCTKGGNRRLGRLVNSIIDGLADKSLGSAREIRGAWQRGHAAIERAYPKECLDDTAVRDQIYEVLDTPLTLAGYPEFYLDE